MRRRSLLLVLLLAGVLAAPAEAAISLVGSPVGNSAIDGGNVTLTLPAMQQNDLVIVAYTIGTATDTPFAMTMTTAGYTPVPATPTLPLFCDDTFNANVGVFYKKMGASPDATAVATGNSVADAGVSAVAMVFRGVDPTTPMDVTATAATGINTGIADPPSLTHNNPSGVWTVLAVGVAHGNPFTLPFTFPTGYTTNAVEANGDDTVDAATGMGYRTTPANPENPAAMTLTGTDSSGYCWGAVTMALRPAAAVSGASQRFDGGLMP